MTHEGNEKTSNPVYEMNDVEIQLAQKIGKYIYDQAVSRLNDEVAVLTDPKGEGKPIDLASLSREAFETERKSFIVKFSKDGNTEKVEYLLSAIPFEDFATAAINDKRITFWTNNYPELFVTEAKANPALESQVLVRD